MVNIIAEPANHDIISKGERHSRGDGVVCEDVPQDSHLRGDFDVGAEEAQEEAGEGTAAWPTDQRIEDELVTAVGVFLPAGELVIDGKGDTFFEAAIAARKC